LKTSDFPAEAGPFVDLLLDRAVAEKATDIHLTPLSGMFVVRARIDGVLRDMLQIDRDLYPRVVSRLKVLADMDIAEKRRPQDGRISRPVDDRVVDFRLSAIPTLHGESVVLRVLDRTAGLRTLNQIGLSVQEVRVFKSLLSQPSGMIVVTGPTGAGKTTTLYAALLEIAVLERNVLTIEDPIEYEIPRVLQTAVQPRLGVTFASLLRSILRHDPDVIMVGEVRDAETAEVCVRAALTGHLVLTSLHTERAANAVSVLLNFGVKPYALAPALRGVIAQQLVREICPRCRTTFQYGENLLNDPDLAAVMPREGKPSFSVGLGCEECFQSGYRGRRGIFELLEVGKEVRELILRSEAPEEIERTAVRCGMTTLRQSGLRAVIEGQTAVEEVVRAIHIDERA
jgi:type II secretory ATPase GspE/PulE/Tfp pilus assembly ATPase PilB-like protein